MPATTEEKTRLLDLITRLLELVRNDERDILSVNVVLEKIVKFPDFQKFIFGGIIPLKIWRIRIIPYRSSTSLNFDLSQSPFFLLKKNGVRISDSTEKAIEAAEYPYDGEREIILGAFSVADLGFEKDTEIKEILFRAEKSGLNLCPAIAVSRLRFEYKDQPPNEKIFIITPPAADTNSNIPLFSLENNSGVLEINYSIVPFPHYCFTPRNILIFRF